MINHHHKASQFLNLQSNQQCRVVSQQPAGCAETETGQTAIVVFPDNDFPCSQAKEVYLKHSVVALPLKTDLRLMLRKAEWHWSGLAHVFMSSLLSSSKVISSYMVIFYVHEYIWNAKSWKWSSTKVTVQIQWRNTCISMIQINCIHVFLLLEHFQLYRFKDVSYQ